MNRPADYYSLLGLSNGAESMKSIFGVLEISVLSVFLSIGPWTSEVLLNCLSFTGGLFLVKDSWGV